MMLKKRKILLLGAGGHCLSVLDSLKSSYKYSEVGIVDQELSNKSLMNVPIIGVDEDLDRL